jgi:thioredoxin-like negative regulator of GroEL
MRRVIVFAQQGCPACTEFMPRIGRLSGPYRARGLALQPVDINSPQGHALAKRFGVDATPTTVVLRGPGSFKMVGAVGDEQIAQLLAAAVR